MLGKATGGRRMLQKDALRKDGKGLEVGKATAAQV